MDRVIPFGEPLVSLVLALDPNMHGDDTRFAAASTHRFAKNFAPIAAIGVNITGVIRQCRVAIAPIMGVARRDRQFLDQSSIRIGADMRLVAVDSLS